MLENLQTKMIREFREECVHLACSQPSPPESVQHDGNLGILVNEELQQAWRCGANSQDSDGYATSQVWHKEALPQQSS
jgi:hypothetical protein